MWGRWCGAWCLHSGPGKGQLPGQIKDAQPWRILEMPISPWKSSAVPSSVRLSGRKGLLRIPANTRRGYQWGQWEVQHLEVWVSLIQNLMSGTDQSDNREKSLEFSGRGTGDRARIWWRIWRGTSEAERRTWGSPSVLWDAYYSVQGGAGTQRPEAAWFHGDFDSATFQWKNVLSSKVTCFSFCELIHCMSDGTWQPHYF